MTAQDCSCDHTRWSNRKLIAELRDKANLTRFDGDRGNPVREATRLYRETWMNPLLDEVERRLVKSRKKKAE
jgi:hypothetical protein